MAKLSPQRIDRMSALRKERMDAMNAAMDQRDEAIKTFYAALNPKENLRCWRTRPHGPATCDSAQACKTAWGANSAPCPAKQTLPALWQGQVQADFYKISTSADLPPLAGAL